MTPRPLVRHRHRGATTAVTTVTISCLFLPSPFPPPLRHSATHALGPTWVPQCCYAPGSRRLHSFPSHQSRLLSSHHPRHTQAQPMRSAERSSASHALSRAPQCPPHDAHNEPTRQYDTRLAVGGTIFEAAGFRRRCHRPPLCGLGEDYDEPTRPVRYKAGGRRYDFWGSGHPPPLPSAAVVWAGCNE